MNGFVKNALDLHAEAFKSDPFAARRMSMLFRRGIESPRDVAKEANRILEDRRARVAEAFARWKAEQAGQLSQAQIDAALLAA